MTSWSVTDLERRLCRVLDLAARVIEHFGETGYSDSATTVNDFGPEKVVAEVAMLLHTADGLRDRPQIGRRVDTLAHQLAPYARSRRALVDMALHPGHAFKLAVPHVLLTGLGLVDHDFDVIARERCLAAATLASDLPPSATAERRWTMSLWSADATDPAPPDAADGTFLHLPFDLIGGSREDAYALTHLLFYITDFGHRPLVQTPRPQSVILAEIEALVVRYLDAEDYDLCGELLMAWPLTGAPWTTTSAFAFRVLARIEDQVGVLPCGNADIVRLGQLTGDDRALYALAASYHTAFVMGFLCAVALRAGPISTRFDSEVFDGTLVTALAAHVDDTQGHWQEVFAECDDVERRMLVPALIDLALVQSLRKTDYESVRTVLVLAMEAGLAEMPLWEQAAGLLAAVARSAEVCARIDQVEPPVTSRFTPVM